MRVGIGRQNQTPNITDILKMECKFVPEFVTNKIKNDDVRTNCIHNNGIIALGGSKTFQKMSYAKQMPWNLENETPAGLQVANNE